MAYVVPVSLLDKLLKIDKISDDEVLTVLFTSGSTGEPKGVMLTHRNVGSNIQAINETVHLDRQGHGDRRAAVLPLLRIYRHAVDDAGPASRRRVSLHAARSAAGRRTFAQVWRDDPDDHAHLFAFVPQALRARGFCQARRDLRQCRTAAAGLGGRLQGEVRRPARRSLRRDRDVSAWWPSTFLPIGPPGRKPPTSKDGTVGRPIPGHHAKIVHLETGEELGPDEPGMLLLSGPNVMKGYLNRPDLTAEKVRDGWYVTGDVAKIDRDGFITITGRESRFSKIGGEMVPHIKIEETIRQILGGDEEQLHAVVSAVPDARKGERLVVLHTAIDKSPDVISREARASGPAEPVDSLDRQLFRSRIDPGSGKRQGRSESDEGSRAGTLRRHRRLALGRHGAVNSESRVPCPR